MHGEWGHVGDGVVAQTELDEAREHADAVDVAQAAVVQRQGLQMTQPHPEVADARHGAGIERQVS
jgi:hypothetical protein